MIIQPESGSISKFLFEESLEISDLKNFISNWRVGSLDKYYKSEDLPLSQEEKVVKVVAKNFDALVRTSDKYVLLMFYAPWCSECKSVKPIFEKLAEKYS